MGCDSPCCGRPTLPPPDQAQSHPAALAPIVGTVRDQPEVTGARVCETKQEDDCNGPEPDALECETGCCSEPVQKLQSPSCCDGKASPCCDMSCLDRIALRECKNDRSIPMSQGSPTLGCAQGTDGKPCIDHASKARRAYAQTLEALGCICRALIALRQESCCPPPRRSSFRNTHCRSKERAANSPTPTNSCCAASGVDATATSVRRWPTGGNSRCGSSRTGAELAHTRDIGLSCTDVSRAQERPESLITDIAHATDLEQGLTGTEQEHVILSISGMTCTGCERKLVQTLGTLPAVKNLRTSLVLSRAEFDLAGATSAVEIMKHLERTTEFKCEKVTDKGSNIDLVVSHGDAAALVNLP